MKHTDIIRQLYTEELYAFMYRVFQELNPGDEFIGGTYLRALCRALEKVFRGETRRLIITMPPRHLKSLVTSVSFPAWVLGRDPTRKIICASYSNSLSLDFSLKSRLVMNTPWYKATFPAVQIHSKKNTAEEFWTTHNGKRLATSVGGTLTGKGGDIVIVDDFMKAEDAHSETKRESTHSWFKGTVSSRLDDPKNGAIVVVAQRLHEDDLIGRLIQTGDWEVLKMPAKATERQSFDLGDGLQWNREPGELLHPERVGEKELNEKRSELGTADFEAQYQQRPVLPGGNLIKLEWFGRYEGKPKISDYEAIVQSWDTAAVPGQNNDWSVCTTWGLIGQHVDLLDVHRKQHIYPDLLHAAKGLRKVWRPKLIVVEKAMTGISLWQDLRRAGFHEVQALSVKRDKVQRMSAQSAKIEKGQVRLPKEANWLDCFLAEVAAFSNGKHDDQVDSMSQVLRALEYRPKEIRTISRYKT